MEILAWIWMFSSSIALFLAVWAIIWVIKLLWNEEV